MGGVSETIAHTLQGPLQPAVVFIEQELSVMGIGDREITSSLLEIGRKIAEHIHELQAFAIRGAEFDEILGR